MRIETVRHIESACPHCGRTIDASTGIEPGTTPSPGDITLCFSCGGWLMYGRDLEMTLPTLSEADFLLEMDDGTRAKVIAFREAVIKRGRLK